MHRSKAAALAAVATLTFVAVAAAQTPPPPPQPRGPVFVSPMGQPFRSAPESRRSPVLLWLAHADVDGDERISRDEFVNEAVSFFANTLDANRDRAVTSAESTDYWREQAPEMLGRRDAPVTTSAPPRRRGAGALRGAHEAEVRRPGGPRGWAQHQRNGPPPAAARQTSIMLGTEVEPVMSCDRDFSRRVDAAEFQTCAERRFFELDVNRDGYFSLYESDAAREMLAAYEEGAAR